MPLPDLHVTFFRGKTSDGIPWVLSYEDGPTATEPERSCRVYGLVGKRSVPELSVVQGTALRELLPILLFDEVDDTLRGLVCPW